jgi:hypothetical protein
MEVWQKARGVREPQENALGAGGGVGSVGGGASGTGGAEAVAQEVEVTQEMVVQAAEVVAQEEVVKVVEMEMEEATKKKVSTRWGRAGSVITYRGEVVMVRRDRGSK